MSNTVIMGGKEVDLEEMYKQALQAKSKKKNYTESDFKMIDKISEKVLVKINADPQLGPEYNNIYLIKLFVLGQYSNMGKNWWEKHEEYGVKMVVGDIIKKKPLGDGEDSTTNDNTATNDNKATTGSTSPFDREAIEAIFAAAKKKVCDEANTVDTTGDYEYPVYPYKDKMFTPSELGMDSGGDYLSSNMNSLKSYLRLLWQGGGRASTLKDDQVAWGNKFFQKTYATCKAIDGKRKGETVSRFIYTDNVPTGVGGSGSDIYDESLTCAKVWNDIRSANDDLGDCKFGCLEPPNVCVCSDFTGNTPITGKKSWAHDAFRNISPNKKNICDNVAGISSSEDYSGPAVGLIPSMIEDMDKLIPGNLFNYNSIKSSQCKEVKLKIRTNAAPPKTNKDIISSDTKYVTVADIEQINPNNFVESFTTMSPKIPDDTMFYIYIGGISLVGLYILKRAMEKRTLN